MMAKSPRRRDISRKQAPESAARDRQLDFGQHLIRLERGGQRADKEIARLDPAFASHRLGVQTAAEREHDRRHFGSRIGMRKIAADGAAIADLRMRDDRQRFGDERQFDLRHRIALEAAIARQRADAQAIAAIPDAGKLFQRIDVDQHGRLRQTEVHGRHQALPAGQEARLVAMFGLQRQGLLERAGSDVAERRGFHNT